MCVKMYDINIVTCVRAPPAAEESRRLGGKNKQKKSNKESDGGVSDEPAETEIFIYLI